MRSALEERVVREHLLALGVSPDDAASVIERLSPEERTQLAARVQEVGAGGEVVVAIGLAVIVSAIVILILELMGRRVISRP